MLEMRKSPAGRKGAIAAAKVANASLSSTALSGLAVSGFIPVMKGYLEMEKLLGRDQALA
jgi:hypothetical protein